MTYPHLSEPFTAGMLRLPNRIVMPPLVVFKAAEDGTATPAIRDHYAASAGPGLIVVEATAVSPEGRLARSQLGIFEDRQVDGLAALARLIHANGAVAAIQIHHAGSNTETKNTQGLPLVAPSSVPRPGGEMPLELDEAGIERIIQRFVDAARRAMDAGFDAVELHAAHGYLISQFLSPLTNRRVDRWGGTPENRARFLREIVARVRAEVGNALEVYCRLGVADAADGGLTLEEGIQVARRLEQDGVRLLHVSHGIGGSPSGTMRLGAAVKRAVHIPVIGVGGVVTPRQAEEILAAGVVDLVAVGRGMLADPRWASLALEGAEEAISLCRSCLHCHHFGHGERCPARLASARRLRAAAAAEGAEGAEED